MVVTIPRRQGCYNQEGNIVILAAYLGQIPKIRQKLRGMVTIVVDERDAELLDARGIVEEESTIVQEVKLSQQVIIRSVLNLSAIPFPMADPKFKTERWTTFKARREKLLYLVWFVIVGHHSTENKVCSTKADPQLGF